jgi:hypothetical protein
MSLAENNVSMERVRDGAKDVVAIQVLFKLIISCCVDSVLEK